MWIFPNVLAKSGQAEFEDQVEHRLDQFFVEVIFIYLDDCVGTTKDCVKIANDCAEIIK